MEKSKKSQIAVVVATHGRPAELQELLASLTNLSHQFSELVVVDSSKKELARLNKEIVAKCKLKNNSKTSYHHINRTSLTAQKNFGVSSLNLDQLDYIQILDDDTVPSVDYISRLTQVLERNPKAIGASGLTPSLGKPERSFHEKVVWNFFRVAGLDSSIPGKLTFAGLGIAPDGQSDKLQFSEWLYGCSMWRANLFRHLSFDEELVGSCLFEDVIFSSQARVHGELLVDPKAVLLHNLSAVNRPDKKLEAYRFSRNRWNFVRARNNRKAKVVGFAWSIFCIQLYYFALWLRNPHKNRGEYRELIANTASGFVDGLLKRSPR